MEKPKLLNVNETAEYLRVSKSYVYNRSAPNAPKPFPFKPLRIGRKVLFRVADLDAFIEQE